MVRKLVWELLIERNQDKAVLLLNLLLELGIHIVILPYEGVCVLGGWSYLILTSMLLCY